VVVDPRHPEDGVRVAVHESGVEDARHFYHFQGGVWNAECGMGVSGFAARADPGDALSLDQHGRVVQDFDLGQLAAAPRARRPAAGDDLAGAGEERAQSVASPIGRRIPCRRAAAIASG